VFTIQKKLVSIREHHGDRTRRRDRRDYREGAPDSPTRSLL
jgi:hypothetical protein